MDPRTIRTRQLIVDSFNQLIRTTDFQQISVTLITEITHINRATFYAHFADKYELLDEVLNEVIGDAFGHCQTAQLDAPFIAQLFLALAHVHEQMHTSCRRGYDSFTSRIEEIAKVQMEQKIRHVEPSIDALTGTMMTWALYGAFTRWQLEKSSSETDIAEQAADVMQHLFSHKIG